MANTMQQPYAQQPMNYQESYMKQPMQQHYIQQYQDTPKCAVCGKLDVMRCSNCKHAYYCSREHQVWFCSFVCM